MDKSQEEFGRFLIANYARRHDLTYRKTLEILSDTEGWKDVWEWVNCDNFLCAELRDTK